MSEGYETIIVASAEGDVDTKTSLDSQSKVNWTPGDQIIVFSAGESAVFTAINESPSRVAKFKGTVSFIMGYDETGELSYSWALYPYCGWEAYSEPYNNSKTAIISTDLPSAQYGKDNTFADGYAISLGRSESLNFSFKNAYSGFWIRFNREDITSVELKTIGGESIAGKYSIGLSDTESLPYVKSVDDGVDKIALYAPDGGTFKKDTKYYIITFPDVQLSGGVSFTAHRSDGYEGTYYLRSGFKFNRNLFRSLGSSSGGIYLDGRIEYQANIDNGTSTGWVKPGVDEIWYTTYNHEVCTYTATDATGNVVVSNTYDAAADRGVIKFADPLTVLDDQAFTGNPQQLKSVTLPGGLEVIGKQSFQGCQQLQSVHMGNSVTVIGERAFRVCSSLHEINLSNTLEAIGSYAFSQCNSLTGIEVPASVTTIPAQWPDWPDRSTVNENGMNPFYYCQNLESFSGPLASADGKLLLADNGERVVSFAWDAAEPEGEYSVPSGIKALGNLSFGYTDLGHIILPESLEEIQSNVFYLCPSLTKVTIRSLSAPSATENSFANSYATIYVPFPMDNAYTTGNWASLYSAGRIVVSTEPLDNQIIYTSNTAAVYTPMSGSPNTLVSDKCFYDAASGMGVITFAQPLTVLDDGAFKVSDNDNGNITSVKLPESLTIIGNSAFYRCYSLSSVSMGDNVTIIGEQAFNECSSLASIDLSDNLVAIGQLAFVYSGLTSIDIPQSVTYLNARWSDWPEGANDSGSNSFLSCQDLQTFTGKYASQYGAFLIGDDGTLYSFALNHPNQKNICVVPSGVQYMDFYAFGYSECTEITLPEGIVWIFGAAFYGSDQLQEINIPASVQTISAQAFGNCPNLTTVRMESGTAPNLVNGAFTGSNSVNIFVPGYHTGYDAGTWAPLPKVPYQTDNEIWFHGTGSDIDSQYDVVKSACGQDASAAAAVSWSLDDTGGTNPAVPIPASLSGATISVVKFPNPVTEVVANAFKGGTSPIDKWPEVSSALGILDYVSLPKTVTAIGDYAFYMHTSLVEFPAFDKGSSLKTIGKSAFSNCSAITEVNLADIETIGQSAFLKAESLTEMLLGPNLTYLSSQFVTAETPPAGGLTLIFYGYTPPTIQANAFVYPTASLRIYVPAAAVDAYKRAIISAYDDLIIGY